MSLPDKLLKMIYWACYKERYPDRAAFLEAVQEYQDQISPENSEWAPNEVVLGVPRVWIGFHCWVGDEQPWLVFPIDAEGGAFTMGELFHKLCDGIGEALMEQNAELYDHHFFEGISRWQEGDDGAPLYAVRFGS
ncbi:MAG: hypothetical protein AAFV53_33795 [Myxococcota bacterium]